MSLVKRTSVTFKSADGYDSSEKDFREERSQAWRADTDKNQNDRSHQAETVCLQKSPSKLGNTGHFQNDHSTQQDFRHLQNEGVHLQDSMAVHNGRLQLTPSDEFQNGRPGQSDTSIQVQTVRPLCVPSTNLPHPATNPVLMVDILKQLTENMAENTRMLKKLAGEEEQESQDDKRDDQVRTEVRVGFLRLIDVDTVNQLYTAEIFLQAKWTDSRLKGKSQRQLDDLDYKHYWSPQVVVANIDGDLDEDVTWTRVKEREAGYRDPVIYQRRKMRGKFKENLELKHFPVDVQALTLQITSDRTANEVSLVEDHTEMSLVSLDNFNDEQEWRLFEHVEVIELDAVANSSSSVCSDSVELSSKYKNPRIDVMCHVFRKPGYFMWNVILIMFFISSLSLSAFSIDPALPQSRLGVTLTLLLTAVAFKFVVAQNLPTISYLTYLDIYVLTGMVFLCLQATQNAVVAKFVSDDSTASDGYCSCVADLLNGSHGSLRAPTLSADGGQSTADLIDWWSMMILGLLVALFNICFMGFLAFTAYRGLTDMKTKEVEYQNKKRRMAKKLLKRDSIFQPKSRVHPEESDSQVSMDYANTNCTGTDIKVVLGLDVGEHAA